MSNYLLVAAGAFLSGIGFALMAIKLYDYRKRLHAIERQLSAPLDRHGMEWRTRRDVGEAALFDLVKLRDEMRVAQDWLDYSLRRYQHVAAGGSPDDPPTKWNASSTPERE